MTKKSYIYTNKHQKRLMQNIMDKINSVTYQRLQLELALYGYVDMKKFIKKYPIESFLNIKVNKKGNIVKDETCQVQ